jgi:hypothetical protein
MEFMTIVRIAEPTFNPGTDEARFGDIERSRRDRARRD